MNYQNDQLQYEVFVDLLADILLEHLQAGSDEQVEIEA